MHISNLNIFNQINYANNFDANSKKRQTANICFVSNNRLCTDTISFKKQYSPNERGMENISIVDIMAHNYLDKRRATWKSSVIYNGLSPFNVSDKLKENFYEIINKTGLISDATTSNIKDWKPFLTEEYKNVSCHGINAARSARAKDFSSIEEIKLEDIENHENLADIIKKLKNNYSYKLITMLMAFDDVKDSNRHIPLPFDINVLAQTFKELEDSGKLMSIESLSKGYHSNLIEKALIENKDKIIYIDKNTDINKMKECWVCINGEKNSTKKQEKLINLVEIFSNKNWCTHAREDKAKAQVETGDFYVYLKRDEKNNWVPTTAMSINNHYKKKIGVIEIQGIKNNYILTDEDYKNINRLINQNINKFKFKNVIINKNTPTAYTQWMIMDYLQKGHPTAKVLSQLKTNYDKQDNLKNLRTKLKQEIQILKPNNNLMLSMEEKDTLDKQIIKLKSKIEDSEKEIIKLNEYNNILYYKLLKEIGANPQKIQLSGFDMKDVIIKLTQGIPSSVVIDDSALNHPIPQNEIKIKSINSINIKNSTPIQSTLEPSFKEVILAKVIEQISSINLEEFIVEGKFYKLDTYNPIVDLDAGIKNKRMNSRVSLMYFGIDEDKLLSKVKSIDTFYMKNSGIKTFPKNLEKVNVLYCNHIQYNKFHKEISVLKRNNPNMKIYIYNAGNNR